MSEPEHVNDDAAGDGDLESDLVNLRELPLAQLQVVGDTALSHALQRVIDDVSNPDDVIAGFQSAI